MLGADSETSINRSFLWLRLLTQKNYAHAHIHWLIRCTDRDDTERKEEWRRKVDMCMCVCGTDPECEADCGGDSDECDSIRGHRQAGSRCAAEQRQRKGKEEGRGEQQAGRASLTVGMNESNRFVIVLCWLGFPLEYQWIKRYAT
jgi:hypothetical protein